MPDEVSTAESESLIAESRQSKVSQFSKDVISPIATLLSMAHLRLFLERGMYCLTQSNLRISGRRESRSMYSLHSEFRNVCQNGQTVALDYKRFTSLVGYQRI